MKYKKLKVLTLMLIVLSTICLTVGCNHMTEEEKTSYEASSIHEYQVVSVYPYIKTETNAYGGILDQTLYYNFIYIDENGNTHQDEIRPSEGGSSQVVLGDANKYIVNKNNNSWSQTLQLTQETFSNIKITDNN